MKASAHAIGGEPLVERMEKSLRDRSRGDASDADVSLPWSGVEFDAIDRVVSKKYRIRPEDLRLGLPPVPSYSASDPGAAVQVVTNGGG